MDKSNLIYQTEHIFTAASCSLLRNCAIPRQSCGPHAHSGSGGCCSEVGVRRTRKWQWHGPQVLQPGSCFLAGQMNKKHLDSRFTSQVVKEAAACWSWNCQFKQGFHQLETDFFVVVLEQYWFLALLWINPSGLLHVGNRLSSPALQQQSGQVCLPITMATVPLLSLREPCTRTLSIVRGLQPKCPLWHCAMCHNIPLPMCGGLPSAGDSPAKEHLLAGIGLSLTASVLGNTRQLSQDKHTLTISLHCAARGSRFPPPRRRGKCCISRTINEAGGSIGGDSLLSRGAEEAGAARGLTATLVPTSQSNAQWGWQGYSETSIANAPLPPWGMEELCSERGLQTNLNHLPLCCAERQTVILELRGNPAIISLQVLRGWYLPSAHCPSSSRLSRASASSQLGLCMQFSKS